MQSDYHIEDLVYQTGDVVVYRARNKTGIPHAINRIKFPYEILSGLEGGRFEEAYKSLITFKHPCVRNVIDGGQDPVDDFPWVATKWWNGTVLNNKIKEESLTEEELQRIRSNGEKLIEQFGEKAAAFAFTPQSVIVTRAPDGGLLDTFAIDYFAWFRDWSLGLPPGGNRDPERALDKLIEALNARQSPISASTPQALTPPEPPVIKAKPLVAPPATAGAFTPTPQVTLASSSSGGSLKAIFIIVLLLGLVGGGLWWIKNQPPKADPQTETASDSSDKKDPSPTPPDPEKESPKITDTPTPKPPAPIPPRPTSNEPRRPSVGEILEATPNNPISLERLTGEWVYLKGEVESMDGGQTIHLKNSDLKATLRRGSVSLDPGTKVRLVGYLKSPTLLQVPDNTDVEVLEEMDDPAPKKDIYGPKDEAQLRTMAGQKVTVEGKILGFKTSNSGKTFYLLLNDSKPEFAFSISAAFANTDELNQEFLESLVGKTVKVSGPLKLDDIGGRLNIYFKYKSHLEISE